ncbi:MAG: hypothetical protein U5N55_05170 [Cypionkella sp.]|nr:hypothetical protein [Cypionkella sp.]
MARTPIANGEGGLSVRNKLNEIITAVDALEAAPAGGATAAQGALADSAVQPAALAALELGDLADVDLTGAAAGNLLSFDGTQFVPVAPAAGATVDLIPTDGSANAVASNGVFDALALKANSNPRVFAGAAAVAAVAVATPTLAEIQAFVTAQAVKDSIVFYTGDDTVTATPTHVYLVDGLGIATLTHSPTAAGLTLVDEDDMVSDSDILVPSQQSVKAYVDRQDAYLSSFGNVRRGMRLAFKTGTAYAK